MKKCIESGVGTFDIKGGEVTAIMIDFGLASMRKIMEKLVERN